jgi:hypothetical protein
VTDVNLDDYDVYFDRQGKPISRDKWAYLWADRTGSDSNERRYDTGSYRRVGFDETDGIQVSTVWLGLDHGLTFGEGPLEIFETMVFGGQYDQEQERYSTEQQAIEGHARWVRKAISERGC